MTSSNNRASPFVNNTESHIVLDSYFWSKYAPTEAAYADLGHYPYEIRFYPANALEVINENGDVARVADCVGKDLLYIGSYVVKRV